MKQINLTLTRDEFLALSFSLHHTLLHLSLTTEANKLCFANEYKLLSDVSSKFNNLG